ncbi:hotdog domain-containing protein [Micromonospora sp. NPDC050200]|uniref:thioesterase family protein n=1 Tax=Micromonospora sp. NPDC050200 TaxID=3155664 RepID=UPI0033DD247C
MRIWETATGDELVTSPVREGERSERTFEVTAGMLTGHVPGAPSVLSTPALIGLLEDTAADILRRRLAPGAASVGTWIGVRHRAPALAGQRVEVRATVAAVQGRHVTFDVSAQVAGRTIGDGQVTQTLIRSVGR